jgi:formylglycine-generating enzyme required for sulfatase activity
MKRRKNIFTIVMAFFLLGFVLHKHHFDEVRKQPKTKLVPPGTIWLRDNLFMDITEINNLDYIEFLYWLERKDYDLYQKMLPDTLVRRHKLVYCEPYVEYYLRHPAYRNYPVIGVSYEQAVEFCKWRSDRVNEYLYVKKHIGYKHWNPDSTYQCPEIVRYRLPTKEEWEYAAAAGLDYKNFPLGYEQLVDENKIPVSLTGEYSPMTISLIESEKFKYSRNHVSQDASDETVQADWGKRNSYGIYNLTGNVSEIIADTLIKGLNYKTDLSGKEFRLQKEGYVIVDSTANPYDYKYTFHYQKPEEWLGFRCVCEVLKEK